MGDIMNPSNPRYKKIRNLILENIDRGADRCVRLLNKNCFTAPCGRKSHWKADQVIAILNNETWEKPTRSITTKIPEKIYFEIMAKKGPMSEFFRSAICEKIRRDKL